MANRKTVEKDVSIPQVLLRSFYEEVKLTPTKESMDYTSAAKAILKRKGFGPNAYEVVCAELGDQESLIALMAGIHASYIKAFSVVKEKPVSHWEHAAEGLLLVIEGLIEGEENITHLETAVAKEFEQLKRAARVLVKPEDNIDNDITDVEPKTTKMKTKVVEFPKSETQKEKTMSDKENTNAATPEILAAIKAELAGLDPANVKELEDELNAQSNRITSLEGKVKSLANNQPKGWSDMEWWEKGLTVGAAFTQAVALAGGTLYASQQFANWYNSSKAAE